MDIFFLVALIITSLISVTFIVERGLALRRVKVIAPAVESAVENYRSGRDLPQLLGICQYNPSTLSRLLAFTAEHLDWSKGENVQVLEIRARHEVAKLERGLVVLEIIVGIAPLLGLVGTIYGLITLFGNMDTVSSGETSKFSQGISLALNATLMGLLIAIPTLVAWSYYTKKVETHAVEMESLCDEFLRKHYRAEEQTGPAVLPPPVPAPEGQGAELAADPVLDEGEHEAALQPLDVPQAMAAASKPRVRRVAKPS
jgi:biopolymer transport protein ExbB